MPKSSNRKSRRITPWDGDMERTASQQFLYDAYEGMYREKHSDLLSTGEDDLFSFVMNPPADPLEKVDLLLN